MAQRSQVPKFGDWESEENVPYTVYFENARKGKKGGKMNANDPHDNSHMSPNNTPSGQEVNSKSQKSAEVVWAKDEHHTGQEDGESGRSTDSPLLSEAESHRVASGSHHHPADGRTVSSKSTDSPLRYEIVGRKNSSDSPHHHHGGLSAGDTPKRGVRQSVSSDRSSEHSPLHPYYQTKVGGKGSGFSPPSSERKGSTDGSHTLGGSTPGRSRLRSVTKGDETPDHSPAVPKFGDWNESDPTAAEGYTHIFNLVREEKHSGAGKVPIMPTETSYSNVQKQRGTVDSKGCGCFPWGKK